VRIRDVVVCDRSGRPRDRFARGEDIHVKLTIHSDRPEQPIHALVGVNRAADDLQCFAVGTHADGMPPYSGQTEYEVVVQLFEVPLQRADYDVIAYVGDENAMTVFDRRDLRRGFTVTGDRFDVGLIEVKHRWRVDALAAAR
jgi:hypothetical protein